MRTAPISQRIARFRLPWQKRVCQGIAMDGTRYKLLMNGRLSIRHVMAQRKQTAHPGGKMVGHRPGGHNANVCDL